MAYFLIYNHTHTHTHAHTHTHVQRICTHQLYMWQKIHLSDDGTNTLTHKHCHMHMYSIQFNCTCACLYRPLILCKFVYQAFCTCIVSPRIEYIVSPSGTLNVHKHCTLAHTHHCINVAIHMQKCSHTTYRYTDTHMTYTHKHTHTDTDTQVHMDTHTTHRHTHMTYTHKHIHIRTRTHRYTWTHT